MGIKGDNGYNISYYQCMEQFVVLYVKHIHAIGKDDGWKVIKNAFKRTEKKYHETKAHRVL